MGQVLRVPAAGLSIALFYGLDTLRKRAEAGAALDYGHWAIRATIALSRLRTFLVYCWIGFALYGFIAVAHATCRLPAWFTPALNWHFGSGCAGP